jgi:uncharacterized protein
VRRLVSLAAAAGLCFACNAAPGGGAPAPPASPTAGAAASGPRVTMPSGAVYRVELALTPEDQAQGLMYRESLPPRAGMLFVFDQPAPHHFWMKNTMIPLDMIWMDPSGKVLFISAGTPPCKGDPCPSYGPDSPAASVLEIAGGKAAKEKIAVGSVLRFENVK